MMYLCIDMKCFFATVECVERGLNPWTTPLVVADASKGEGALCLAVSPCLKQYGVKSRGRLFEIKNKYHFIIAKPRMKKYMEYAIRIHRIFLKYVAAEDIHTYSIDEAFLNVEPYLHLYTSITEIAFQIMDDIHKELGIIATCGAGENLYLAKIALDIIAKNQKPYYHFLTTEEFYKKIWFYPKLKKIWQIGHGIESRLHKMGLFTLHDIAVTDVKKLEQEFGVIGLDLYEHAWGRDKTTIQDIKAYKPQSQSLSRNQILFRNYSKQEAWIPLIEMLFLLCMDLTSKKKFTRMILFYIGYQSHTESFHSTFHLDMYTDNYFEIKDALRKEFEKVKEGNIRRIGLSFSDFIDRERGQNTLFFEENEKYTNLSKTIHTLWTKYGKNHLVLGTALNPESTLYQRNTQIGGHNSE